MKDSIVICLKCHNHQYYELKNASQKNPRTTCDVCGYKFSVGKYFKKGQKGKKSHDSSIITDNETQGERVIGSSPLTKYTKIDDDVIEAAILKRINDGDITDALIGRMIEFYNKIRQKDDKIKDDIDMEEFKLIGASLKDSG